MSYAPIDSLRNEHANAPNFSSPCFLFVLLAGAAPPVHAAESLEVALNWVAGGDHAPLYYAKKLGRYSKAGIEVDLQAGKGSVGSIQRVSVGNSPIGLADMAVVLSASARARTSPRSSTSTPTPRSACTG